MHSCRLSKTFLKNRANLLPLYGKDTKKLLHAIPHHGLDIDQIFAYFHQGLSLYIKQYIQMMSGGQFYEKRPEKAVQCFDTIAENARN